MPSDFGDESGEKLFDWMLRVGQDSGEEIMRNSANALRDAFRKARGELDVADTADAQTPQVVRLNMEDFAALPEYDSIKEIIDERLSREHIDHEFSNIYGKECLVFRVVDAPAVNEIFKELELQTEDVLIEAEKELSKTLDSQDKEGRFREGDEEVKDNTQDPVHEDQLLDEEAQAKPLAEADHGDGLADPVDHDAPKSLNEQTDLNVEEARDVEHDDSGLSIDEHTQEEIDQDIPPWEDPAEAKAQRASDQEPLETRAKRAKDTSQKLEAAKGKEREIESFEVRSK